jgi:hypothetical protein
LKRKLSGKNDRATGAGLLLFMLEGKEDKIQVFQQVIFGFPNNSLERKEGPL